jgi:hypothetical protein
MGWIASAQLSVEGLQESATIRSGEGWNIQSVSRTYNGNSSSNVKEASSDLCGIPGIDREELMK